jgi:hypothetical protein
MPDRGPSHLFVPILFAAAVFFSHAHSLGAQQKPLAMSQEEQGSADLFFRCAAFPKTEPRI